MAKKINIDELIEYCDTERSMLNAHNGGNSVACAALRRVVDFVKEYAVETEPNKSWVSVKDRLPDDVKDVIVCDELGLVYPAYYYTCDECWMYSFAAERCEHKITHWMPLPEPPKEDDAE